LESVASIEEEHFVIAAFRTDGIGEANNAVNPTDLAVLSR
jgi:hypothetical protein